MTVRHAALLAVVFTLTTEIQAQTSERISRTLPADVEVTRDIIYASYGDRSLLLDLYQPAEREAGLLPAIVVIRGGGWRSGDKEGFGPMAAALAERGLAAISIEYRASGEATFPAAVEDTKAAVRWLRANAARYRLDPDAIGAIGGSAGAHLAVYLGVTAGDDTLEGVGGNQGLSSAVSAMVGLATPVAFRPPGDAGGPVALFLGAPYDSDPGLWERASPITHVSASSPPVLLVHSESDSVVPFQGSLELAAVYGSAGVPVEVVLIPNAPHAFWNRTQWFGETMDRSAAFLMKHLGRRE